MKRWIGRWLMGVAGVHTLFGLVVFAPVLRGLAARGVFDAVGEDAMSGAVVWFLLFGAVLFIAAQAIDALEALRRPLPVTLGVGLLALAVAGVVLMPASGFWLVFPPALALLWPRRQRPVPA